MILSKLSYEIKNNIFREKIQNLRKIIILMFLVLEFSLTVASHQILENN